MDDFEIEIKKDFLQEALDLLQNAEQSFLALEKDPSNQTLIDTIFRVAHNLKGTSRAVGFGQIAELTHRAENLLLEIKQGKLIANDKVVSVLLSFNDKVREMVEGLGSNLDAQFPCEELMVELEKMMSGEAPVPVDAASIADAFETQEAEAQSDVQDSSFEETHEPVMTEIAEVYQLPKVEKVEAKKEAHHADETIRVSLGRLEKLNDLVGELVILQTLVESSLSRVGENKTARSLGKLCKDIQDLSMSLRMVPVGPTFQKLTRIVRDTSKVLGKKIDLRLLGEETEIDKTVVESLGDPLVHIIRNAIDHGVETPAERMAANKSEEGVVEVMAFHEGNFLVIQITDDGKGINANTLIEKAKKKGIIPQHAQLTEQQGIELIFHPGFSTKDEVSEVSGRGVGMDVVKTNIEALGGEVKVQSKLGSGSCFRLILPLTLAIIEGMLIESADQTFVIPKSQVQEVNRLDRDQVTNITGRVPYLTLRNEIIPLFHLEQDLGLSKGHNSLISLIVKHGEHSFAVGIHDVVRLQQVVVKPPTAEMSGKHGVMGTTILGDGKPSLIIDLLGLYLKKVKKESNLQNQNQNMKAA